MANTDLFDSYFKRADLDGDGQISGAEAVAFFQGSGLPKPVLAQVWTYADQRKAGYLGRQEFYNALKLVTVAQRKRELTPDIVRAALYSPASAQIPAPQINLAAAPAPRAPTAAPQMAGITSVASQNIGVRPPQVPGNANINQQYFSPQQNQFMRPPQAGPSNSVSHLHQVPASQGVPRASIMAAPRPGGSMGVPTTQNQSRAISPPSAQDGFGLTGSGLMPSVQPRQQATTGSTPVPKPQDAAIASNQSAVKDSKVSGNGFAPDSLFGDVFSVTPAQPAQSSSSAASSTSSLAVSPAIVPSPAGSQPSAKPGSVDTLQSTFSQQPVGGQSAGRQNHSVAAQTPAVTSTSGFPAGAGNSASSQSQAPWPKMAQSDIHRYMKVFVQVDTDRDGKITGEQARNLFLSWRLPREVLIQVWDLSDQDNDSMLSLREFCTAVYLMERYIKGRPLPTTLPSSVMSDENLLAVTSHPAASYGSGTWGPASGSRPPQFMTSARPPPAPAARPPRPPTTHHAEEKQPAQQKPKVPVLEKHLVDQLSQEEQDSLRSKFEEAFQADRKVEELEKEIADSRQKIEFYRVKMQELILYKSRCDNRLNEVTERVAADKREAESLAKKYEEKYRQTGDVASKLTIEEATFRDLQEKKMELYRSIVKMEEGATGDGVLKERAEHIQSSLEELVKSVNERCKQYGLHAKPTSLVELPFGWQPGIQEGAADWDEDWDKFEDEGFTFVKELTLDVQNVVAPPKQKSSVENANPPTNEDVNASTSKAEAKLEKAPSPGEANQEKEATNEQSENGTARSPPDSPAGRSAMNSQLHEFRDSPSREVSGADDSPHAKEIQSDMGGTESVLSGDKGGDEPGWGRFDTQYDTESLWGFDSVSGKDLDHDRQGDGSLFGLGEFGLKSIKTGSPHADNLYQGKHTSIFADSVPSTPAYDQGRSLFADSVPSTPAYNQGRSLFADSVPSTPAYNQGKSTFAFADSVPSTPAYNQGRSSFGFADSVPGTPAYNQGKSSLGFADSVPSTPAYKFNEGSDDHSFDSFSRFDSFNMHDSGLFQSSSQSLSRFDSMRSTRDSDQNYGFPSSFDSYGESRDSEQSHGFSRFDSFRDSDQTQVFSRFDSFRESDNSHGFPSRFDSFRESDNNHGFPSSFDSFRETKDSDHSHGFSRFDSFNANDSGFFQSSGNSFATFDSAHSSRDFDNSHRFSSSFDDADPFGSTGPFKTSVETETPRKNSDNWKAF
ncbi:hypothetical protein JCGZ_22402 [Jatropha curcas]|uniref:Uncharacterized protein n=1 Tax=Jatropha curcas TaxID=180498 RepID=A0A067LGU9_JATCU|nr:epidermal growth factor receptor substrate 15-like 1 [Jatropha curcas]KDP43775.1 hypothetical protein JCGZ_22402 [Jatropha curcas]